MNPLKNPTNRNIIISIILLSVFVYGLVQYAVSQRVEAAAVLIYTQLGEQRATLVQLAASTATNDAVPPITTVVADCSVSDRQQFNDLLGRLDQSLQAAELDALQQVFPECAYLDAHRKVLMADRLERAAGHYGQLVAQLQALGEPATSYETAATQWQALAAAEEQRGQLFTDLVEQQRSIIVALQAGAQPTDPTITRILEAVSKTQQALAATRAEVGALHDSLGIQ